MKFYFKLLVLLPFSAISQQSHTVIGFDFGFSPDTLYMSSGDTVHFTNQGYHSMTEIDSTDWANNISNHNGGFWVGFGGQTSDLWFTLNTPGKYYYICDPHAAMGMKGLIYVDFVADVPAHLDQANFNIYYDGSFRIDYVSAETFALYDLNGKLILTEKISGNEAIIQPPNLLSNGTYIGVFKRGSQILSSKKIAITQ